MKLIHRQRGAIALGPCLILALSLYTTYKITQQTSDLINQAQIVPDLKLSAVTHAFQQKWCYEITKDNFTDNKKAFITFVTKHLIHYVTNVTHSAAIQTLWVLFRANPINTCALQFKKSNSGLSVSVKKFSKKPIFKKGKEIFSIEPHLTAAHIRSGGEFYKLLGDIDLTYEAVVTLFNVRPPVTPNVDSEKNFINTVLSQTEIPQTKESKDSYNTDIETLLKKASYGNKSPEKLYYERRD